MALIARLMVVATAVLGVAAVAPAHAAAALSLTTGAPLVADANNDGVIGPGDTLSITLPVTNNGADAAGLQATLSSPTAGVHVVAGKGSSSYPDVAAGGSQSNTMPFQVTVDASAVVLCGTTLNFDLSFTSDAGPTTVHFSVPTGWTGSYADYSGGSAVIGDVNPTLRAGLVAGIYNAWLSIGTPGIVRGVRVHLAKLTHPDVHQLKIELVAPGDVATATLIDHQGTAGDTFENLDLVPDPAVFANVNQQGAWRLRITADNPNLLGHLDGWTLQIAKAECAALSFADLQVPDRADPGAVNLDASHSTSVAPGGITQYDWDFGSGAFTQSTTTPNVSHPFPDRGRYTVRVRGSDSRGVVGIATKQLVVSLAPSAAITPLAGNPKQGVNVTLDGSSSSDPEHTSLTYEWDLAYNGTDFTPDTTGAAPTVQFPTAGPRTIALRVTDADGATALAQLAVDVLPASAPVAKAAATPNPAVAGAPVSFDAGGSSDSDGTVVAYAWDLDANGSYETATGSAPTVSRSYPYPGIVTVGLRVTDNDGKSSTTHVAVIVRAAAGGGAGPGGPGGAPGAGGPAGGQAAGGGGAGAPTASGLAASLAGSSIQALKLVTNKGLSLRCSADRAAQCSVIATLNAAQARRLGLSRSRKKAFVLGCASVGLKKAGAATITVRVSKRVLAELRRVSRVTVVVTGTAVDGGGGRATLRRVVLLRR